MFTELISYREFRKGNRLTFFMSLIFFLPSNCVLFKINSDIDGQFYISKHLKHKCSDVALQTVDNLVMFHSGIPRVCG